jgi:hypothetical protein
VKYLIYKETTFMLNFVRKNMRKSKKLQIWRRRLGNFKNFAVSAAAAQKFLKISPSRRRLYFFGKNRRRRRRLSRSAYTSSQSCNRFGLVVLDRTG